MSKYTFLLSSVFASSTVTGLETLVWDLEINSDVRFVGMAVLACFFFK